MTILHKIFIFCLALYATFLLFSYSKIIKPNRSTSVADSMNEFLSGNKFRADNEDDELLAQNYKLSSLDDEIEPEIEELDKTTGDSLINYPTDDDEDSDDDYDYDDGDSDSGKDANDNDDTNDAKDTDDSNDDYDDEDDFFDDDAYIEQDREIEQLAESKVIAVQEKSDKSLPKDVLSEEIRDLNPFDVLGAYPPVTEFYAREWRHDKPKFGLYRDDDYCEKVDAFNLENPDNLFKTKTFYTNFPLNHVPGSLMARLGTITTGELDPDQTKNELTGRKYHLPLNINTFYVSAANLYYNYEIGKHFACATQSFNHVPGQFKFVSKDTVLELVDNYADKFITRPHCFEKDYLFPKSYKLYEEKECKEFFNIMHSNEYQESLKAQPIQYLIKVSRGSHQSTGVFLLDKTEESYLNGDYNYGKGCGTNNFPLIAQTYIANPLLLDRSNKFDFRIYMLIASTNPLIVYYHDGFLRVALDSFDKNSTDKSAHITNTHLAIERMIEAREENKTINDMTEQQIQDSIWWPLEKLETYLTEIGRVTEPNWLNNYLRREFKKALVHLVRMSKDTLWQQSNVYEVYGVDFMLDDNLNLWFIESNPNPQLTGFTESKNQLYLSVVMGTLDIQFAYYKSRMARILDVIKRMREEMENNDFIDLEKWKKEYQEASKNRLDPKYKINVKNNFVPIIDENLPGAQAYFGLVEDECVII